MAKRFIALPKKDQNKLSEQFACLQKLARAEKAAGFQHVMVSVFDHVLSEREAKENLDGVGQDRQAIRDLVLHTFACELCKQSRYYSVKFKGRYKQHTTFRAFTSEEAKNRSLIPAPYNMSDRCRFILVFPELELIYFEGSDFTHHLYLKKSEKLELVAEIALSAGLHLL